jgi:hypothetical protein
MDSQLGIEDDFERKPDTGLYDWPNEKYEHKKFQDWPRFNGTINTDIPNSTNNAENTHNSMEEEAPAATASPLIHPPSPHLTANMLLSRMIQLIHPQTPGTWPPT